MMTVKRIIFIFIALLCFLQISAQPPQFDPKRFEADLEQFITVNAGLSPQEASRFFRKMRLYRHTDTTDNRASLKAIQECDKIDLEMKKIQQSYHAKFCKILPAGKVLKVIKADEKFHRQEFRKAFHGRHRHPKE